MVRKKTKKLVSIYKRNDILWLNFQYQEKRYRLSTGLPNTRDGQQAAQGIVGQIEHDLVFQQFTEERLYAHLGKELLTAPTIQRQGTTNFLNLWGDFVNFQRGRLEKTTYNDTFKTSRNIVKKLETECGKGIFEFDQLSRLVTELGKRYSPHTLHRAFNDYISCGNWAVRSGRLETNPWANAKALLPKRAKSTRSRKAFTETEALAIITAFRENIFCPTGSCHSHSHYTDFVEFLFLTGCRPEDAIALPASEVVDKNGSLYVRITKSYSKGQLKGTKQGTHRTFKCNQSLERILRPRVEGSSTRYDPPFLVFPAQEGGYIHLANFTGRHWKKVVEGLVERGQVKEYLPTYHCRHTAITRMLRQGIDPTTIAAICGNSPEVIFKNYAAADEDVTIPEISLE